MPFKLSEETVDALLKKLATDDDFRKLFQDQPRQALADVGHKPAADESVKEGAWMCMSCDQLADKATIAATRETLRKQLLASQVGHQPIGLEVSKRG